MYAIKLNEIKTDAGQIVRPSGYPPSFWPDGPEYVAALEAMKVQFAQYNTVCFYSRLTGNVFEMYNCFNTEAEAQAFKTQFEYQSSLLMANPTTASNDPADLDPVTVGALSYSRLRFKTNKDNFGTYTVAFEPNVINMDTVDLTGFTRYEI